VIRLFVGLGNPGRRYERNRHNLGFLVCDELAAQQDISWSEKKKSLSGFFFFESHKVWLLKPTTYMNLSGEAIRPFIQKKGILAEEVMVIHDEVALPLGQIRLKPQGGTAGHNGIESVIRCLGTDVFYRLRLGVNQAPPGIKLADYVLANFMLEEETIAAAMVKEAAQACLQVLHDGEAKAMSLLNARQPSPKD